MAPLSITESELLEALRAAMTPRETGAEDAFTVQELAEATGKGDDAVRKGIRRMLKAGTASVVRVMRPRMDGLISRVPAYRLVGPLH